MATTTAFDWQTCEDPAEMLPYLGNVSERKKRQFVRLCVASVKEWIAAQGTLNATLNVLQNDRTAQSFMHWIERRKWWVDFGCTLKVRCDILREIFPPPLSKRCPECNSEVIPIQRSFYPVPLAYCVKCDFSGPPWPDWIKYPFPDEWRTPTVIGLARQIDDTGDFSAMPILADALEEAGCEDEAILDHCRSNGKCSNCAGKGWAVPKSTEYYLMRADPLVFRGVQCQQCGGGGNEKRVDHLRGCWVIDLILGRE